MKMVAGLGALLIAPAVQAQILVVRATGPSAPKFKAGSVLAATAKVALKPGDLLVLLDERSSWSLRGPGSFPVRARQAPAAAPRLMSVDERRARIGAVRTPDADSTTRPNLWLIDIAQPGPTCIVDPAAPLLWRADEKAAARTSITGPTGASATLDWNAGQETRAWPATLPIVPGATYRITGGAKETSVIVKPLPSSPDSVAGAGKALLDNGCSAQLDLLVAQMGAAGRQAGS
ncbi:MAG: hypothetical protein ABW039_09790 [Sphingobium sp.]